MEMFQYVPVNEKQEKSTYVKTENYTQKCEQMFALLHDIFDFFGKEYKDLEPRKDNYPKFAIKMNSIATVGNALNNAACKQAIEDGYRLYVKENKRYTAEYGNY